MELVPLPGIEPIPNEPDDPIEWIHTTGKIQWRPLPIAAGKQPCEDCLQLILDQINGREFTRAPGLARDANWIRKQDGQQHLMCNVHAGRRIERGDAHGR